MIILWVAQAVTEQVLWADDLHFVRGLTIPRSNGTGSADKNSRRIKTDKEMGTSEGGTKEGMVGTTGFEPATSWSQTKCSTGLSYVPNRDERVALDVG